jgi:hypothetical protein
VTRCRGGRDEGWRGGADLVEIRAGGRVQRVDGERAAEPQLGFALIAAEPAWQLHQQGTFGGEGLGIVGRQREGHVDLAPQSIDGAERAEADTAETGRLAEIAEHGEVRARGPVVERDGGFREIESAREQRQPRRRGDAVGGVAERERFVDVSLEPVGVGGRRDDEQTEHHAEHAEHLTEAMLIT